jgi:hypothetical protein
MAFSMRAHLMGGIADSLLQKLGGCMGLNERGSEILTTGECSWPYVRWGLVLMGQLSHASGTTMTWTAFRPDPSS